MPNTKMLAAGVVLTLLAAYVVVNLSDESEACTYGITITDPDPGTQFGKGMPVDIFADWDFNVGPMDLVDVTGELQCTMTSRVEDGETIEELGPSGSSFFSLTGPDDNDSDVDDPFCVVVSGDGLSDRVGVTFIDCCMCCP